MKKFQKNMFKENPICINIILINVIVFVALKTIPSLVDMVSLYPEVEKAMQRPWTLFTVIFAHVVTIHMIGNMAALLYFGRELEKRAGSKHLLAIYIISGVMGSLAMTLTSPFTGWTDPSLGASAAVLGVLGTVTIMSESSTSKKLDFKKVLVAVIVLNVGMLFVDIKEFGGSSFAHLAGIATGLIYGYFLKRKRPNMEIYEHKSRDSYKRR